MQGATKMVFVIQRPTGYLASAEGWAQVWKMMGVTPAEQLFRNYRQKVETKEEKEEETTHSASAVEDLEQ